MKRGSVLIVVLFVLAVLSIVSLSLAYRAGLQTRQARHMGIRAQLTCRARSAVNIALARLAADQNEFDHPAEPWSTHKALLADPIWQDAFAVGKDVSDFDTEYFVIDEEGKLHIDRASSQQMEALGMTREQIAALLDWIDADDVARSEGAEGSYYQKLSRSGYEAKNAPVAVPSELQLVRGVDSAAWRGEDANHNGRLDPAETDGELSLPLDNADGVLQRGIRDLLTCLGEGRVNLNTAPPAVLNALPLSDGAPAQIIAYRQYDEASSDALDDHAFVSLEQVNRLQGLTETDRQILAAVSTFRSSHFRILARSTHRPTGLSRLAEVLVRKRENNLEILEWVWNF